MCKIIRLRYGNSVVINYRVIAPVYTYAVVRLKNMWGYPSGGYYARVAVSHGTIQYDKIELTKKKKKKNVWA